MDKQKINLEKSIAIFSQDLKCFIKDVTEEVAELKRHLDYSYYQGPTELKMHIQNLQNILIAVEATSEQIHQQVKNGPSLQQITEHSLKVFKKTSQGIKNLECHLSNYGYQNKSNITLPMINSLLLVENSSTPTKLENIKLSPAISENKEDCEISYNNEMTPVKSNKSVSFYDTSKQKLTVPHASFGLNSEIKLLSNANANANANANKLIDERNSLASLVTMSSDNVCATPTVAALKRKYDAVEELDSKVKEIRFVENVDDSSKLQSSQEKKVNFGDVNKGNSKRIKESLSISKIDDELDPEQIKYNLYVTEEEYAGLPNYVKSITRNEMNKELMKLMSLIKLNKDTFTEEEMHEQGISKDQTFLLCLNRLRVIERIFIDSNLAYKFGSKIKM